jgi:hypothetical protein
MSCTVGCRDGDERRWFVFHAYRSWTVS